MNADEIRTLYVETLARAQRAADLKDHPQRDDGTPRDDWQAMSERIRRMYLDAATPFVDALAAAGLLATRVEEIGAIPVYSDEETIAYWRPGTRRYMTEPREVTG